MTSYRLYAFRDGEREELLKDHVEAGLEAIRTFYLDGGYHKFLISKLSTLGVVLEPAQAEAVLLMAYTYHDLGKAVEPLQTRLRSGSGAPGHETLSAYLAASVMGLLNSIGDERWAGLPDVVSWGTVLAILAHMSALRDLMSSLTSLDQHYRPIKSFYFTREAFEEVNSIIDECWDVEEIPPPLLPRACMRVSREGLEDFVNKLGAELPRPGPGGRYVSREEALLRTLSYLVLHPLIIADEYAVAKNMGPRRGLRRWARDFVESVELARRHMPPYWRSFSFKVDRRR